MKYLSFLFMGLFGLFFNIEKWIINSMASVKYTAFVDIIQGKVNGSVFAKGVYGAYIRSRGKIINAYSTAQILVRASFGNVAKLWRGLSDAQRQAWDYLGKQITFSNRLGDSLNYTGFNAFMKLNLNLLQANEAVNNDAPDMATPQSGLTLSLNVDTTPGSEDIELTFSPAINVSNKMLIYATPVLSPGVKNPNKSDFKFIAVEDSTFITGSSIKVAYTNVFGVVPSLGQKIYVQAKYIDKASGFESLPLQASGIGSL